MSERSLEQQINSLNSKLNLSVEKQARENKFAEEANLRFDKNLSCFEKYYPNIAAVIRTYEVRKEFCLHVTTSGHGNIIPKGEVLPLYNDEPIVQAKQQVEEHVNSPVFTSTDYTGYPKRSVDGRIHTKYMAELALELESINNGNSEGLLTLPDVYPTAMIFGIGLGYHIPMLLDRCSFKYIFIAEPDIELFFASLFCIDWVKIIENIDQSGSSLYLHIGVDQVNFIHDLENIANKIGSQSLVKTFCYSHIPGDSYKQVIQRWFSDFFKFQTGHGFYNDAITGFAHALEHIENDRPLLFRNTPIDNLKDIPVFLIGNGPSLDEAAEFIKNNSDKAIIIAAGSAMASLVKLGIEIDFHVLIERPLSNYLIVKDVLPKGEYKKTNLLSVNVVYPETNELYKWSGLALKGNEAGTDFISILSLKKYGHSLPQPSYINPLVSNTGLSFALQFGFRNIYLFGIDNGNLPSGKHHSDLSFYRKTDTDKGYHSPAVTENTLPGNFGGIVYTKDLYKLSHAQLENLIGHVNEGFYYNVGSGAKLKGASSISASDLLPLKEKIDKESVVKEIKEGFFKNLNLEFDTESIGINEFIDVCEHLMSICNEQIVSRSDALDNLTRQERYLYSLNNTILSHVFHILKGSMQYFHCPMLTVLFEKTENDDLMKNYSTLNDIWINYLKEVRDDFPINYRKRCSFLNPSQM